MAKLTPEEEVKRGGRHGGRENVNYKATWQKLEESCSYFSVVALVTKRSML